jgi:hypothetical protein
MLSNVRNLEQIVEQVRSFTGADFVFVLTRKGRLVTHRAPREMPEYGRMRLVRAARNALAGQEIVEVVMPREELVPYGGAAPVDVYVGVAGEQAIVCVVMASWADKMRVTPGLKAALEALEPLLLRGIPSQRKSDLPPARGSRWPGPHATPSPFSSAPPPSDISGCDSASAPADESTPGDIGRIPPLAHLTVPKLRTERPFSVPQESNPDLSFGEAPLGRASLVAVQNEMDSSFPPPEIAPGTTELGRDSLVAVHAEERPALTSSPELLRIDLASLPDVSLKSVGRATLPWVERPEDAKRAADAAWLARMQSPPQVTVSLEDAEVPLNDDADDTMGVPQARP